MKYFSLLHCFQITLWIRSKEKREIEHCFVVLALLYLLVISYVTEGRCLYKSE